MPEYVVYGVGVEVKKFRKKADAKKYLQRARKSYRVMGLHGYIDTYFKNGDGEKDEYFTRTGDTSYNLVHLKKRKWKSYKGKGRR